MALEAEIATFNRKLPELHKDVGKHVLIKGDELVGVFETYNEALKAGYNAYREDGFLVKKIAVAEQVLHFTRDLRFECRA